MYQKNLYKRTKRPNWAPRFPLLDVHEDKFCVEHPLHHLLQKKELYPNEFTSINNQSKKLKTTIKKQANYSLPPLSTQLTKPLSTKQTPANHAKDNYVI